MRGAQKSELDEQIDLFLRCNIEQRALVLHNLSMQQQRMVKFVEVRDLNAVWISEIVNKGRALLARVKKLMGTVQDFYPEVVHRVLIAHTPAAFSTLYAIISPVLNERMRAKVGVQPLGAPFDALFARFDARAIHSWHALLERTVDWASEVQVEAGTSEATTRWLEAGESVEWAVRLASGPDLLVHTRFVPADGSAAASTADGTGGGKVDGSDAQGARVGHTGTERLEGEGACEGRLVAVRAGVLYLCLDNVSSWTRSKRACVTIACKRKEPDAGAAKGLPTTSTQTATVDLS